MYVLYGFILKLFHAIIFRVKYFVREKQARKQVRKKLEWNMQEYIRK